VPFPAGAFHIGSVAGTQLHKHASAGWSCAVKSRLREAMCAAVLLTGILRLAAIFVVVGSPFGQTRLAEIALTRRYCCNKLRNGSAPHLTPLQRVLYRLLQRHLLACCVGSLELRVTQLGTSGGKRGLDNGLLCIAVPAP
jgi:hypothetical protein